MFKLGDSVRVVTSIEMNPGEIATKGREGIVYRVILSDVFPYKVKLDGWGDEITVWKEEELELVIPWDSDESIEAREDGEIISEPDDMINVGYPEVQIAIHEAQLSVLTNKIKTLEIHDREHEKNIQDVLDLVNELIDKMEKIVNIFPLAENIPEVRVTVPIEASKVESTGVVVTVYSTDGVGIPIRFPDEETASKWVREDGNSEKY